MNDLIVYIIAGVGACIVLVGMFIAGRYFKKKIKKKFEKIKKKLFFNGIVRSITISFVTVNLTVGT